MAPGNNERHPGHTGTIPKTKARNNCNVPQEAVTPTRRDMATNLVTTSLDWVPVSEYNTRSNYNQGRKQTNNTSSDHELADLDNSVSYESGFGRFVPVRPQPRALPLNQNIPDPHDDGASASGHTLHPYAHQMQNGSIPHSNHAAAAVMIVNPTTPNAVAGNMTQPFNVPNQNRNNLTRNLNPARNNFEGHSQASNNNTTPPISNSRGNTKAVNLINNMYEQSQGSFNNINENNLAHRESARALGEAIVAACPDAAAVERRLGQIREYIRVTSSLVDTMRNSEDEAYIEHTKEEYDELVQMVMQLKESESKLENMLMDKTPDNIEVPSDEPETPPITMEKVTPQESVENKDSNAASGLKKVNNIENEQINNALHNKPEETVIASDSKSSDVTVDQVHHLDKIEENNEDNESGKVEINEIESIPCTEPESNTNEHHLNEVLKKNILSCVEKVARIEEMKKHKDSASSIEQQDVVVRPVSVQSNGSAYSENELWQSEIKNKMEMSQMRLVALKQQQKRLLKYQEEAKQQIEEMNRERQSQELHPSTSQDNFTGMQGQSFNTNYQHQHANRMYAANQIGVATTLPHSTESVVQSLPNNLEGEMTHSARSSHTQDDRFSHRDTNVASSEEGAAGGNSDAEECEMALQERGRALQTKLRELQLKKRHMENLVSEFHKLQIATRAGSSHNTYSSSGEDSGVEESSRKFMGNKTTGNIKNDDPFKLMEIKALKTALQKTKDLMRSVENYEAEQLPGFPEESYQLPNHSNIHDNKSEGGGSMGGWSTEGSVCRVRNTIPQRHKFTNEQNLHHNQPHSSHEANIASLQELAQELRMETEKIMDERARIKDMVSNKESTRKQKKVNEELISVQPGSSSGVSEQIGPAERRQRQLRALLADKQRELEALLNKEKVLTAGPEMQSQKPDSRSASVINQSYTSEQEEPDSRSEQILLDSQNSRENDNFRVGGDSASRSINTVPSRLGSVYGSDSDTASRSKSNQRNRVRRRQVLERQPEDSNVCQPQANNANPGLRHEQRAEPTNVNMVPPIAQNESPGSVPYPHLPPPNWNTNKTNQDMRNQFTQNSHSQTMDRLLGTPPMTFPPSMPFNMMMPYGMVGGCGCGCGFWGAWCWQQLALQQREIHQLRDQLAHLEERWRAETASHTLNNQVPPGNRANNYWDNFRSYSRQNLLSANSKTNADGHLGVGPAHNPHPLVERSHNTLHHTSTSTSPSITPKRNTNTASSSQNAAPPIPLLPEETIARYPRRNVTYERSPSFSSAPDVLNVNQNIEEIPTARNEEGAINVPNVNINRHETTNSFRNLNIANSIPEIVQSHSNNLNTSAKKKSSSKLPAKNSTIRRNYSLDYAQTSNINIASASETPNPNLASTSREVQDKATSKLFDLLRENVYSEVTTLIGVNESHPDFLIQLFRELQLISSDTLRQRVLQSIRNVLAQYSSILENHNNETIHDSRPEIVTTTTTEPAIYHDNAISQTECTSTMHIDSKIVSFLLRKSEEIFSNELLDMLASIIIDNTEDSRHSQQSRKKLLDLLSKYLGVRVRDVSADILESWSIMISSINECDETTQLNSELSESSLQDVAGSLNLFSSSDSHLHQLAACPYDMWPSHIHMDIDGAENDNSLNSSQDGKVDLITCTEMQNGDLAEADQTCPSDVADGSGIADEAGANAEGLPDVVDTDEVTPTEAEAEWLGLDRVPTRLHMEESSEKQKD